MFSCLDSHSCSGPGHWAPSAASARACSARAASLSFSLFQLSASGSKNRVPNLACPQPEKGIGPRNWFVPRSGGTTHHSHSPSSPDLNVDRISFYNLAHSRYLCPRRVYYRIWMNNPNFLRGVKSRLWFAHQETTLLLGIYQKA